MACPRRSTRRQRKRKRVSLVGRLAGGGLIRAFDEEDRDCEINAGMASDGFRGVRFARMH